MSKVYDYVTEAIIDRLKAGTVPWQKPWKSGPAGAPMNFVSKKGYRGVNVFLLGMQPYECPYWITRRQLQEKGGSVRSQQRSTFVIFWKMRDKPQEETPGEANRPPVLRYYRVFNLEQCEGIEYPKPEPEKPNFHPVESAEMIKAGYPHPPEIVHRGSQAFYRPSEDRIMMPQRHAFESSEEYYSTLFHEMTHSTGHEKRLARKTLMDLCPFGSTNYSKEELVAEMGAAMLCGEAGIENRTIDNSASYVSGWLTKLGDDRRLVVQAAATAQKAVDHILGRVFAEKATETVASTNGEAA